MNTSQKFVDSKLMMTIYVCVCMRARPRTTCVVCVFHIKNQSICVTVFGLFFVHKFYFPGGSKSDHVECFMNELWKLSTYAVCAWHKSLLRLPGVILNIRTSTEEKGPHILALLDYLLFRRKFLIPQCVCFLLSLSLSRAFFLFRLNGSSQWTVGNHRQPISNKFDTFINCLPHFICLQWFISTNEIN